MHGDSRSRQKDLSARLPVGIMQCVLHHMCIGRKVCRIKEVGNVIVVSNRDADAEMMVLIRGPYPRGRERRSGKCAWDSELL